MVPYNIPQNDIRDKPLFLGRHEVNIYYAGALLTGCPHYIDVEEPEPLVDADKVSLSGSGTEKGE